MPQETVVITGSSGLIGSELRKQLGERYELIGIDRPPRDYKDPDVRFVGLDLADQESVDAGMEKLRELGVHHIAAVVHLAAFYDFAGGENPLYDEVTVKGTGRLLEGLRSFEVERFIFSSTMLVHAPCEPGQSIDESGPLAPSWPYPRSKVETEDLLRREHGDIPIAILRIAGVYDDSCDSIPLARQIHRIRDNTLTSHIWPGDKDHGQAFIHVDDLTDAIERLIERRAELPDELVLLLGEEDPVPYQELQDELGRLLHGKEWTTQAVPKPLAKAGAWLRDAVPGKDPFIQPWMIDIADHHYALDTSRARELLDWQPQRNLRQTLPAMIAALRKNPEAWYERHGLGEPTVEPA